MRTVAWTTAERLPAPSTAWNRTSVSPSAVTEIEEPELSADQVVPPSVDVCRS